MNKTLKSEFMDWLKKLLLKLVSSIRKNTFLAVLIFLSIFVVTLAHYLTKTVPTLVQLDLVLDRFVFVVGEKKIELEPIEFQSIAIYDFDRIEFYPKTIKDLEQNDIKLCLLPLSVVRQDEWLSSSFTMESLGSDTTHFGFLDKFSITSNSKVVVELEEAESHSKEFAIKVTNSQSAALIRPYKKFQVNIENCKIKNTNLSSTSAFEVLELLEKEPFLKVIGNTDKLEFNLMITSQKIFDVFSDYISIYNPHFFWEEIKNGDRVISRTSLIKEGQLSYPDYPTLKKIHLKESILILLGKQDIFHIERMFFDPKNGGFSVRLSGFAKEPIKGYSLYSPEKIKDYRLTYLDNFSGNKFIGIILNIFAWLIPLICGIFFVVKVAFVPSKDKAN
jgi:hypothetical protein